MRALFGIGTPRGLQAAAGALRDHWRVAQITHFVFWRMWTLASPVVNHRSSFFAIRRNDTPAAA
jgi:hypothetical protein